MSDVQVLTDTSPEFVEAVRTVFQRSVDADLRDDRFNDSWAASLAGGNSIAIVATNEGTNTRPIPNGEDITGMLVGTVEERTDSPDSQSVRTAAVLDALIVPSSEAEEVATLDSLLSGSLEYFTTEGIDELELWAKPVRSSHVAAAEVANLKPYRGLHQMRCELPVEAEPLPTRPFVIGQDEADLVGVNNRAFAYHPVQGTMTTTELRETEAEPWFDPDGVRMFEVEGTLAGFCWTKIHRNPDMGEIYVIGVDPAFHGKGYGVPMTASGLDWLSAQGLTTGLLYVEADNAPALRTYDKLGFVITRTDRAWTYSLEG